MSKELAWPKCTCGHSAQGHNQKLGKEPANYGCDFCPCTEYKVPEDFPSADADVLWALRAKRLAELDENHGKQCECNQ